MFATVAPGRTASRAPIPFAYLGRPAFLKVFPAIGANVFNGKPRERFDYTKRQKPLLPSPWRFPMNCSNFIARNPASSVFRVASGISLPRPGCDLRPALLPFCSQLPEIVCGDVVGDSGRDFCPGFSSRRFSRQLRREQRETASVLQTTAEELQQMADNIQKSSDAHAKSKHVIY